MLPAARLPFVTQHAEQQQIHRAAKGRAPPMAALRAFQLVADLFINPCRAQVFAAGVQPDAGRTKFAKGVICQRLEERRSPPATGRCQSQSAQLHTARRMADLAIKRETGGLAVFLPDIKPGRRVGEIGRQCRIVLIGDEGGIGRILCQGVDKVEIGGGGGAQGHGIHSLARRPYR